jgi:hypothetical protein
LRAYDPEGTEKKPIVFRSRGIKPGLIMMWLRKFIDRNTLGRLNNEKLFADLMLQKGIWIQ